MSPLFTLVLALTVVASNAGECKYSRRSGLLLNEYQDQGDPNFGGETGSDSVATSGNTQTVITEPFNVLGATGTNVIIRDNGKIIFKSTGSALLGGNAAELTQYTTATTGSGTLVNDGFQTYATARWFPSDISGAVYEFSYEHLKTDELIVDGKVVKSECTMERIEAIISDCQGSTTDSEVSGYDFVDLEEALIVTFKHTSGGSETFHQVVLAISDTDTWILFLYGDDATALSLVPQVTGHINGDYADGGNAIFQSICPDDATSISMESNCDCGEWNKGVYVFKTEVVGDTSTQDRHCLASDNTCAEAPTFSSTPHYLRNRYCRVPVTPVDTCREDVMCQLDPGSSTDFKITLRFRDTLPNEFDEVVFLDQSDWDDGAVTNTITFMSNPMCSETITSNKAVFSFTTTNFGTCGITTTATTELTFVVAVRDSTQKDHWIDGVRPIRVTCDYAQLMRTISVAPEFQTFGTTQIPTPANRKVDFFVSKQLEYTTSPEAKIDSATPLYIGQDIFLTMCYEEGNRPIQDDTEPYGVWASDCKVSKDANFAVASSITLFDNLGCTTIADKTKAFYVDNQFTEQNGGTSDYEWCQTSGKIDAAKWVDSDVIYFQCKVNYCFNNDINTAKDTKCEKSCEGKTDREATDTRRKRDTYPVENNEPIYVQTSLRISKESEPMPTKECVEPVVAIATLTSLIILLILASAVGVLLFMKLQQRSRKRV